MNTQQQIAKVMQIAAAKGMQITESDAARIVRAGNALSAKKAEVKRNPYKAE